MKIRDRIFSPVWEKIHKISTSLVLFLGTGILLKIKHRILEILSHNESVLLIVIKKLTGVILNTTFLFVMKRGIFLGKEERQRNTTPKTRVKSHRDTTSIIKRQN